MLEIYQRLAELRRTVPELTDPSFGSVSCTADEETRVFRMRRGSLELVVNFGDEAQDVEVVGELLFATSDELGAERRRGLTLPPHAGVLVRTPARGGATGSSPAC